MNRIHRIIWNDARQAYVVTHEHAASNGKPASSVKRAASALAAFLIAQAAHAAPLPNQLPTGGQVVAGQAAISQSGAAMTVNQGSNRAVINWNTFSIGSGAQVNFVQPSASAVALNRVTGSDPSSIYGALHANGQVYLVNPNGVLFAKGAQVNVGGLVASTMSIANSDFMSGNNAFARNGSIGSVVNAGTIDAKYVALLGPQVKNQGVIVAHEVALAAGDAVTLDIAGNDLVDVQVSKSSVSTMVRNGGAIQADAGTVILTAQSASQLLGQVINSGDIEANGISSSGGTVKLLASSTIGSSGSISADAGKNGNGGTVSLIADLSNPESHTTVSGSISAQGGSAAGNGGSIETSGTHLTIADTANISTLAANGLTGSWLLDPNDFTIAASGGDITGTALSGDLANNSITIQTSSGTTTPTNLYGSASGSGNINVNDNVSWSANTTLTLTASNNVNVNSSITATGASAGIALNPNTGNGTETASGTGTFNLGNGASINLPNVSASSSTAFKLNGVSYTVINTLGTSTSSTGTDLQGINGNLSGNYVLGSNIDATGTSSWNGNAGFTPIGGTSGTAFTFSTPFTGIFDGLGHTISNLTINVASSSPPVGMFSGLSSSGGGGIIRNVGLVGGSVKGAGNFVGALVGSVGPGTSVLHSYSTGSVTGSSYVGGLVGQNLGTISGSSATGSVTGSGYSGGLVGINQGSITDSYATGNVTVGAGVEAGGLVGHNYGGTISNAYATGSVTAGSYAGGLVGANDSVTFPAPVAASITNSFSTGKVTATSGAGGFAGENSATISGSFWDNQTSGQSTIGVGSGTTTGATGETTTSMQTASTFTSAGWSTTVWSFAANSYPSLPGAVVPAAAPSIDYITIALANTYQTYGTSTQPTFGAYTLSSGTLLSGDTLSFSWGSAWSGTLHVSSGPYAYSTTNLVTPVITSTSGHTLSNYNISWVAPSASYDELTVSPRTITVTPNSGQSKVYNGQGGADPTLTYGNIAGQLVGSDKLNPTGSLGRASGSDVGKYAINLGTLTSNNTDYTLALAGTAVDFGITPKALTESGLTLAATSKVYDATTNAAVTGTAALLPAESVGAGTTSDNTPYTGDVSITGTPTGTYNSKDVATASSVSFGGMSLTGAHPNDYTLTMQSPAAANITQKFIGVSGVTSPSKVYDGTTTATISGSPTLLTPEAPGTTGPVLGIFGDLAPYKGDQVTLNGSVTGGTYDSMNASTGRTVTVNGLSLVGNQAGDYSFLPYIQGAINQAPLTVSGLSGTSRTYNGSTVDALSGTAVFSGLIGTETVTLSNQSTAGTLASANAGSEGVSASITLANGTGPNGGLASNYTLTQPTLAKVTISPAPLTVSGLTGTNRTYNGSTTDALSGTATLNGLQNGETLTLGNTTTGTLASANAGSEPVTTNVTVANGTGLASNYTLSQPTLANVTISRAPLTVSGLSGTNRTYNGSTTDALSGTATLNGLVNGETLTLGNTGTGTLASANAGSEAVTTNVTIANGTGLASNYALTQPTLANVTIGQATLTITAADTTWSQGTSWPPAWSVTAKGFVGTDSFASLNITNSAFTYATNATSTPPPPGTYTVSVSGPNDSGSGNYMMVYAPGSLSVTYELNSVNFLAAVLNSVAVNQNSGLSIWFTQVIDPATDTFGFRGAEVMALATYFRKGTHLESETSGAATTLYDNMAAGGIGFSPQSAEEMFNGLLGEFCPNCTPLSNAQLSSYTFAYALFGGQ